MMIAATVETVTMTSLVPPGQELYFTVYTTKHLI